MSKQKAIPPTPRRTTTRHWQNAEITNNINNPTEIRTYHNYLFTLIEFANECRHPPDKTTFTADELLILTPEHICWWMCKKVNGTEDPSQDDNQKYA